jgi:hypothetical protein
LFFSLYDELFKSLFLAASGNIFTIGQMFNGTKKKEDKENR